jgi:prevent-host-death family protein
MKTVSVYEAKTHLSKLLVDVTTGAEITIERAGKPIAKLVPIAATASGRTPGNDSISIASDFDILPRSLRKAFGVK